MKIKIKEEDKKRISETIKAVESATSAEIVPMIVQSSGNYKNEKWIFSICFSFLSTLIVYHFYHDLDFLNYLGFEIIFIFIGLIFFKIDFFRKFLVSRKSKEHSVHIRSRIAFYEHGLHSAPSQCGLLIFVSVFERKVQILADSGITKVIDNKFWEEIVEMIIKDIKNGNFILGIEKAISKSGEILKEKCPVQKNDVNEFKDELIVE